MKNSHLKLFIIGGSFLFLDQLLKYFARTNPEAIYIWKGFIGWGYFANHGVAFNIPLPWYLMAFITPIIIIGFVFFLSKKKNINHNLQLAAALIIAGAASNLIDRLRFGFVVDYINVPWFTVFNLADGAITFGVGLAIVKLWFKDKKAAALDSH